MPTDMDKAYMDDPSKQEEESQANISTIYAFPKSPDQLYRKELHPADACHLEAIYTEIDKDKSCSKHPEPQKSHSFSLTQPKKAMLTSPTSTPPKLSPKLPNKPNTFTDLQETPLPLSAYATSLEMDERQRKPHHAKILPDSPRETAYGQVHRLKAYQSTMPAGEDDTYEPICFGGSQGLTPGMDPENNLPRHSTVKTKEIGNQACAKTGRSSKSETENLYEKIPGLFSQGALEMHDPTAEETYESIPIHLGKEAKAKTNPKVWPATLNAQPT